MANYSYMQLVVIGGTAQDSKPSSAAQAVGYKSSKYFHLQFIGGEQSASEGGEALGIKVPKSMQNLRGGLTNNDTLTRTIFENGTSLEKNLYRQVAEALADPQNVKIERTTKDAQGNDIKVTDIKIMLAWPVKKVTEILPTKVKQYHWDETAKKMVATMAFQKFDRITGQFAPAQQLEVDRVSIVILPEEEDLIPILLAKAKERVGVKLSDAEAIALKAEGEEKTEEIAETATI